MCNDRELLSQFVDGEVEPEIGRELTRHLESCAPCRGQVETLRAMAKLIRRGTARKAVAATCPDAGALALYLTQSTDAASGEVFEEHLAQCAACLKTLVFLSEDAPENIPASMTPSMDRAQAILQNALPCETRWFAFPTSTIRWVAAAAMMLVAVAVGYVLSRHDRPEPKKDSVAEQPKQPDPKSDPQIVPKLELKQAYVLAAGYRIGDEETVSVKYAEAWPKQKPDLPTLGVEELYNQSIVQVDRGTPVSMQRHYLRSKGPYSYLANKAMTVYGPTARGPRHFQCPAFDHYQPWKDPRFPAPVMFDEHFLFALPSEKVRVGDQWAISDENEKHILAAFKKFSMGSVGDVRGCRAMGALKEVTPDGKAIIDLKITFEGSQVKGPRGAMAGTLIYDMNKRQMSQVALESAKPVPLQGYRHPGGPVYPVDDSIALTLNISYTSR